EPVRRGLGECPGQRLRHPRWHRRSEDGDVRWLGGLVLTNHTVYSGPGKWRLSREHLVEDAAQRVKVGATIEIAAPFDLLRAHVCWRSERHARCGQLFSARGADCPGNTEVRHHR